MEPLRWKEWFLLKGMTFTKENSFRSRIWILFIECPTHFLFNKSSLYYNDFYIHNDNFIHAFCFFVFIIAYQKWIYLGLQSNNFFNHNTSGFIFHFSNDWFVWIIIVFWLRRIISEVQHFFVAAKIFINIFSLNFIH